MRIKVRQAVPDDHAFIYATYLRNKWFDKDQKTTLKRSTWSKLQHTRLERILSDETVLIACLSDDPDLIVGYVFMDGVRPFTYVKLDWRSPGLGISEQLLKEIK